MEEYARIDIQRYVLEGMRNGTLVPRQAVKYTRIIARPGVLGEEIVTWSVDAEGKPIVEKRDRVTEDPETKETGWVVTKADENGNAIVDANGHINQWIISAPKFHQKYEGTDVEGLYKPVGGPQVFVELPINAIIFQWGQEMRIAAGGFINVTNLDDIYGISKRDFEDTYRFVESTPKKSLQ